MAATVRWRFKVRLNPDDLGDDIVTREFVCDRAVVQENGALLLLEQHPREGVLVLAAFNRRTWVDVDRVETVLFPGPERCS